MIKEITTLRMLFLLMIFLHHVGLFSGGGILGVSFFFILSGFVMTIGYYDKITNSKDFKYDRFLLKRLVNIYPLHWLCLVCSIFISQQSINSSNIYQLITNALLLHSWIPIDSFYFSFNGLSWFISSLLFFIIIFPFILKFLAKQREPQLFGLFAVFLFVYISIICLCPENYYHHFLYINPIVRSFDCVIGLVLALFFKRYKDSFNFISYSKIRIDLYYALIFFLLIFISFYINLRYCSAVFWLPICCLIYLVAAESQKDPSQKSFVQKILSNRILVNISSCYYSFYLTHQLMITTVANYIWWGNLDSSLDRNLFKLFTLILTLIVSYVINVIFLRPIKLCSKKI